ncbi:hypothetical protein PF010_g27154 [Phytophthora fragariae]|nr:hypothetical protein PF009_g24332 [Phytophthora fragariae]KAE8970068.1 hypothetical protein PF011_g26558 [Phytophthora fragariae]KAE9068198.1 hypothetical protein PF010_g27154 [Phytophthora fragariae]KAE9177977.1 hypothetical protein PF002_g28191 [Phytophthora fragariae]
MNDTVETNESAEMNENTEMNWSAGISMNDEMNLDGVGDEVDRGAGSHVVDDVEVVAGTKVDLHPQTTAAAQISRPVMRIAVGVTGSGRAATRVARVAAHLALKMSVHCSDDVGGANDTMNECEKNHLDGDTNSHRERKV